MMYLLYLFDNYLKITSSTGKCPKLANNVKSVLLENSFLTLIVLFTSQ